MVHTALPDDPSAEVSGATCYESPCHGYRLQVARAALASHPQIAFDLLVFKAAISKFTSGHINTGPDVSFSPSHFRSNVTPDAKETAAGKTLAAIHSNLSLAWKKAKTEEARFRSFVEISREEKLAILAYCTASTLKPQLAERNAYETALSLTETDVCGYWRPTAINYISKIKTAQLLELGTEIFSATWALKWKTAKKGDVVKELDRAFGDPSKFSGNKDTDLKLRTWLPEGMAVALPERLTTKTKNKAV